MIIKAVEKTIKGDKQKPENKDVSETSKKKDGHIPHMNDL